MRKFIFIFLFFVGLNCKEKIYVSTEELNLNSRNISFRFINETIQSMEKECKVTNLDNCEKICQNKLNEIHAFFNINEVTSLSAKDLAKKIFMNGALTKQILVEISLELLKTFNDVIVPSRNEVCKIMCTNNYQNEDEKECQNNCEPQKRNVLFLFGNLISKKDLCIFLMETFGADLEYCDE